METLTEPMPTYDAQALAAMQPGLPAAMAPQGQTAINTYGDIITAQRVAVPRHPAKIMAELKALATVRGESYVYSWTVNDRRNKRQVEISGPTVKLANDLARIYGNCLIRVRVDETPSHWIITPRFVDLETGYGYERPFQQRKSQDAGMKDQDRQADLVFQIGVSKAIRNVIVNVLSTYVEYAVEEAQNGLVKRFADEDNAKRAHSFIDRVMHEHEIALLRVEAVVGRKREAWTVKDLVRVYAEMRGIYEKLTVPDEVYPSLDDARLVSTEKKEKAEAGKSKPKPEAAPKTDQGPAGTDATKTASEADKRAAEDKALEIPESLRRPLPTSSTPPATDDTAGLFGGA